MRRKIWFLAPALLTLLWVGSAQADAKKKPAAEACGEYGTSVHFEKTPSDAARKALKEEKLVMVLHISGLFEDPDFT